MIKRYTSFSSSKIVLFSLSLFLFSEKATGGEHALEIIPAEPTFLYSSSTSLEERKITDEDIEKNGWVLFIDPTRKILDLSHQNIGQRGLSHLLDNITPFLSLTDLRINENIIDERGALLLAQKLEEGTPLRRLNISWNPLGPKGALRLVQASLSEKSSLTSLDISSTFSSEAFADIMNLLTMKVTNLRFLTVSGGLIGNPEGESLARMLETNDSLLILKLKKSWVWFYIQERILSALRQNQTLLDLKGGGASSFKKSVKDIFRQKKLKSQLMHRKIEKASL